MLTGIDERGLRIMGRIVFIGILEVLMCVYGQAWYG